MHIIEKIKSVLYVLLGVALYVGISFSIDQYHIYKSKKASEKYLSDLNARLTPSEEQKNIPVPKKTLLDKFPEKDKKSDIELLNYIIEIDSRLLSSYSDLENEMSATTTDTKEKVMSQTGAEKDRVAKELEYYKNIRNKIPKTDPDYNVETKVEVLEDALRYDKDGNVIPPSKLEKIFSELESNKMLAETNFYPFALLSSNQDIANGTVEYLKYQARQKISKWGYNKY